MAKVSEKFISWDLQGKTHPDPPKMFIEDGPDWPNRGVVSRRTLSCGCVQVTYSSPDIPFSRSATEKYCQLHKTERNRR